MRGWGVGILVDVHLGLTRIDSIGVRELPTTDLALKAKYAVSRFFEQER
jgi:hypothetical protein